MRRGGRAVMHAGIAALVLGYLGMAILGPIYIETAQPVVLAGGQLAALALLLAHADLEDITLERDVHHEKARLESRYAELVYDGLWFSSLRRSLDRFVEVTQEPVCGTVTVRLHKGTATCRQRQSPSGLYRAAVSSHDAGDRFDHSAAAGFSYVWSMPQRLRTEIDGDRSPAP